MENQPMTDETPVQAEGPSNYDDAMLEAFVQKPEKFAWYKKTFAKFNKNGVESFTWSWSWWAFFVTFWFLLYRKSYLAALGFFGAAMVFSFLPLGTLIFMIIAGGTAPYFVYKTYTEMLRKVEEASTDTEKRLETMRMLGGYHTWVVVVAAIINALIIIGIVMSFAVLGAVLGLGHH